MEGLVIIKHPFLFQKVEPTSSPLFPLSPSLRMKMFLSLRKLLSSQKTAAWIATGDFLGSLPLWSLPDGQSLYFLTLPFPTCPLGALSLWLGPSHLRPREPWWSEWSLAAGKFRYWCQKASQDTKVWRSWSHPARSPRDYIFSQNLKHSISSCPRKNLTRESESWIKVGTAVDLSSFFLSLFSVERWYN